MSYYGSICIQQLIQWLSTVYGTAFCNIFYTLLKAYHNIHHALHSAHMCRYFQQ